MVCRLFKPYSYTVGLRYILPFGEIRDILIYAPGMNTRLEDHEAES